MQANNKKIPEVASNVTRSLVIKIVCVMFQLRQLKKKNTIEIFLVVIDVNVTWMFCNI